MADDVVRRAERRDVEALVELREHMFTAMGTNTTDPSWRGHAHDWFTSRIEDSDYHFAVVEVDGAVVASAVGAVRDAAPSPSVPEGRDVLVSSVSTAPHHRGRGYGRLAFEAVMAWAHQTDIGRAELLATAPGRGMYERAGFRETSSPLMRAILS